MNSIFITFVAAFLVAVSVEAFSTSRIVNANLVALNAIPPFNWPGSTMPPSNLESLFSGGSTAPTSAKKSSPVVVTKSAVTKSAPAPAKKPAAKGKEVKKDMTWGGRYV